jgi:hypothetical protein
MEEMSLNYASLATLSLSSVLHSQVFHLQEKQQSMVKFNSRDNISNSETKIFPYVGEDADVRIPCLYRSMKIIRKPEH